MSKIINVSNKEMFNTETVRVIKNMVDPTNKLNDEQLKLFIDVCRHRKLDPRLKHIYPIPRKNKFTGKTELTIQVSIDGFRIIAERTGKYAPGRTTEFAYDDNGALISATAFVNKRTEDGTWHEVSATAFLVEYRPSYVKEGDFWSRMPTVMLEKCAESRALRRAFPSDFSGLYSEEEMSQAKDEDVIPPSEPEEDSFDTINEEQACELDELIGDDTKYRTQLMTFLQKHFNVNSIEQMPTKFYSRARESAQKNWQARNEQTQIALGV